MNYTKQLNAFEEYSDRIGLPAYAQLIYYKLFAMNNRAGWVEVFEAANHFLMYKAGVNNEKTFIKYRNLLKQHGLIEFVAGKKGQPTKYTLIEFDSTVKNTAPDTVNNTVENTVNRTVIPTVNCTAIYKHKQKQKESKKKFTPPNIEEVKAYCLEKGLTVDPVSFYEYFESGNWTDSKGNQVRSWKQKILTWQNFSGAKEKTEAPYKPPNGKGVFVAE